MIVLWGFFLNNNFFIFSIFLCSIFIYLFIIFVIFIFFFDWQLWATIKLLHFHYFQNPITVCSEIPFSKNHYRTETNQLICKLNQLNSIYMIQIFTERYFQIGFKSDSSFLCHKFQNHTSM